MQEVLRNRVRICKTLVLGLDGNTWFSFLGRTRSSENQPPRTVPVIVISGGSARKIAAELDQNYNLAWHPMNMRGKPVYLFVHQHDYHFYASTLKDVLGKFRNMHLIGWSGGAMTGFGAARAAVLAFADTLTYRPQRILMMDQDVIQTEGTRHTNPSVQSQVMRTHRQTGKSVVRYGIGYPTRVPVPRTFSLVLQPENADFNSPAQQFVSITAPFRKKNDDGVYPSFMVAGGEDMLMGMQLQLTVQDRNIALLSEKILKKELHGMGDTPNTFWNETRVTPLKQLFEEEKDILVTFQNQEMDLNELMRLFAENQWISGHPNADSYNVSACVVERIILRLFKGSGFPQENTAVFGSFRVLDRQELLDLLYRMSVYPPSAYKKT